MSLNDIHLPLTAIADLYKTVLIEDKGFAVQKNEAEKPVPEEIKETKLKKESPTLTFLGNNKKQVVIIVSYPDTLYIPDDKLAFLTTILTACKLNLADIALLNFANSGKVLYKDFFETVPAKCVIFFGVQPDMLSVPMNFPFFQVQHFDNVNYLSSPPLDQIEADKTLKGNLWTSLKKIFNL
jgi:hypothetical protein